MTSSGDPDPLDFFSSLAFHTPYPFANSNGEIRPASPCGSKEKRMDMSKKFGNGGITMLVARRHPFRAEQ
jgi:hypothetical protein